MDKVLVQFAIVACATSTLYRGAKAVVPIAATALGHGLTIVTLNVADFGSTGATQLSASDA